MSNDDTDDETSTLPPDFPVAIVEFMQDGTILRANARFEKKFFGEEVTADEPFRRKALPETILAALVSSATPREGYNADEDRKTFGRVDIFHSWDERSTAGGVPTKIGYPLELEDDDDDDDDEKRRSRFENERYFRYWLKSTPKNGERTFFACLVDDTRDEIKRQNLVRAEKTFSERLSKRLIHSKFRRHEPFELITRPRNGQGRAGGDFFFLWPLERKTRPDLVLAVVGDAGGRELMAASTVQQVATILRTIEQFQAQFLDFNRNPAEQVIKYLAEQMEQTSVMRVYGLDGIVLVFDLEESKLYYAEGKSGGFILSSSDPTSVEVFGATTADADEETHPPIFGRDSSSFNAGELALKEDDVVIAMTDGARDAIMTTGPQGEIESMRGFIADAAKETISGNSPPDTPPDGKAKRPKNNPALESLLHKLVPEDANSNDDRLAVAISLKMLKDAMFAQDEAE